MPDKYTKEFEDYRRRVKEDGLYTPDEVRDLIEAKREELRQKRQSETDKDLDLIKAKRRYDQCYE